MLATPLSWLLALDRWLCVPAFQRVCSKSSNINMPKNRSRDKRGKPLVRSAAGRRPGRAHSVKELLARSAPGLTRVTDQAARQSFWGGWLCHHLPTDLGARVSAVAERDGTLVIFAASAAWCARLRYAVQELEPQIRAAAPQLIAIAVRVQPRS